MKQCTMFELKKHDVILFNSKWYRIFRITGKLIFLRRADCPIEVIKNIPHTMIMKLA